MLFSMLIGPSDLPTPPIQCLSIDLVCITSCFYDYDC